ncbi:WecC, UDP-N-acetyl-D-mannosaminuronate dehydrogenase [Pyrenophora tritici-repentis]|nr:WecC, UDP-N-acetyl-D-mannosaminuronate dehydrogenase [Pyrenophora tritici-repentis]PZD43904.1 WecC, UDP-N-acetyl-D-mannosaminuronate dehydrogenase [Pyrenophora tritici-repentis]
MTQSSPEALNCHLNKSDKSTTVAIIGVGYVGEHLMEVFSSAFKVIGYDVSASRIEELRKKYHRLDHVKFSNDERVLTDASHFLVCVPTTLALNGQVDSSYVRSAISMLDRYVTDRSIVVVESTVAVGMTREFLGPLARSLGVLAGMSPERIDPGRVDPPPNSIPKVVSGLDDIVPGSLRAITQLYETVFDTVVPVSKPEVAEMSKLYENCQRTIAIAYANEMADACQGLGIDPFEVAQTAASKPFGYLPMYPSLGIGGHCIPVNPVYLMSTCNLPLLQQAHERMMTRPSRIASQLLTLILDESHRMHGAAHRPRVLVVGLGFKAGQSDLSHSPGLQLLNFLRGSGEVDLMFCDPLGYRMSNPDQAGAPICLLEYGLACDGTQWPPGFNTSTTPRPRLGSVPYGKRFTSCTVEDTLALTYDDGPSQWTPDLLDILKANNVKATFFIKAIHLYEDLVNHRSDKTPAIIRRMYNEGHQIAGHTWGHKNMDEALDSQQRRDEMVKAEIALNDILGFFPTYMRPPFNACGPACQADMGELGYHVTSNDIEPRDWAGNYTFAEEQFLGRLKTPTNRFGIRAWLGIAHDTHERTVHGFTQFMINQAREYGFKMVTVGECLNDPEENWYRDPVTGGAVRNLPPKDVA